MTTEILLFFVFVAVAGPCAIFVLRFHVNGAQAQKASAEVEDVRRTLASLQVQYNSLLERHAGDQRELLIKREGVCNLEANQEALQRSLADSLSEVTGLTARLSGALANAEQLNHKLSYAEQKIVNLTRGLHEAENERSVLRETVRVKELAFTELQGTLKKNDADLQQAFENASRKVMAENAEKFSEKSRVELEVLLKPFKETLEATKGELQQSKGAAKEHEDALKKQVANIVAQADALTRVFKGRDMKAFGDLGEELLERVLNAAGLARGMHYEVQAIRQDEDEKNFKPDVIVNLPDDKHLIIDSKAVLKNYNNAVTADDKKAQKHYLEANVTDILNRVKELHEKHYPGLRSVRSPDFVLMYIPFEQAFLAALELRPSLVEEAMRMKVAIVTNGTLLATLRTVSYVWSLHTQQRNAEAIAKQGGRMLDKFINFVDDLQKARNAVRSCHKSVDEAWKKLHEGNANLVSEAMKLHSMGVEGKKKPEAQVFQQCMVDEDIESENGEIVDPGVAQTGSF